MNNEAIQQQVINNTPGLIFWKDKSLRYLGCNENFLSISGLVNSAEFVKREDFDMPWRIYAEEYRSDDNLVLEGQQVERIEYLKDHQNIVTKVFVKKKPLLHKNKIIGVVGYTQYLAILTGKSDVLLSNQIHLNKDSVKKYYANLSHRESQCLFYSIRGLSCQAIANKLNLSERTIETYLINMKNKFNVNSKSELITAAINHGFNNIIPEGIESL